MSNFISSEDTTENTKFYISSDSAMAGLLESAISLWKKNRKTLGMFPRGAFEASAKDNCIIYLLEEGIVKGYLLYRIARQRVAITHLCISDDVRGKGGARILFNSLKDSMDDGHCRGIEVRCRSDYEISRMWPSLGFECIRNIVGRAKEGSELTIWFYRFDVYDFFYDMMPKQDDDDLTWAVLDANIIFKLSAPENLDSEEAQALMSDGISSYVRYFVTPEIFVETERKKDVEQKKYSNDFARKFEKIEVKRSTLEEYKNILMPIWGSIDSDRDRSDLNHIVYAAASGFQYFITQDEGILDKSEEIYEACNISVLRPVGFITQLDKIENHEKYTPRSISRTKYQVYCPSVDEISHVAESFCLPSKGEKKKSLEAKIRAAVANTRQYKTVLVSNDSGVKVAFLCFKKNEQELSIEIMRHNGDITSKTIAQNYAWSEIFSNSRSEITIIRFSDDFSTHMNDDLFRSSGFLSSESGWIRLSANLVSNIETIRERVKSFIDTSLNISQSVKSGLLEFLNLEMPKASFYEEVLWPLKLENFDIPTYLIPIKPVWALNLFDEDLANQELWGADPARHFNIENVYYRSAKQFKMVPGARILWYVSTSNNSRISEIRACSRLISSETDTAKSLFKKYQRLGIYEWKNLMEITKNDPNGKIMALRFYQTEYFKNPISLDDFSRYGINGQPFGPKHVTNEQFLKIYTHGMDHDE